MAPPGGVLVRTTHSVISIGTEKMKVEQAKMNLLQKAKARPDQVRKVLETPQPRLEIRLRKGSQPPVLTDPLGYSAAGVVEAVDEGNSRFRVGDAWPAAARNARFMPSTLLCRICSWPGCRMKCHYGRPPTPR